VPYSALCHIHVQEGLATPWKADHDDNELIALKAPQLEGTWRANTVACAPRQFFPRCGWAGCAGSRRCCFFILLITIAADAQILQPSSGSNGVPCQAGAGTQGSQILHACCTMARTLKFTENVRLELPCKGLPV
jgi:hypothetical protein